MENMVKTMKKLMKINVVWSWFKDNLLLLLTFIGVILGFVLGLTMRQLDLGHETIRMVAYPGELFMRLLKLMILPLVIASLITGSASLNAKMNGMIALRTIMFFILTSLTSAMVGLGLVVVLHPGDPDTKADMTMTSSTNLQDKKGDIMDNFLDLGRNLIPDNLFQAAFETAGTKAIIDPHSGDVRKILTYRSGTNTLGIIFFCLTFGTVLGSVGKRAKPVIDFFTVIDDVIMRMVNMIMWISPVGIASVISAKILLVSDLGLIMSQLGYFIVTVCGGIFLYQFTVLQAIFFIFTKKNPFKFWWGLFQAWMTAFATASTAAALPITFRCMEKNKVDPRISKFVLPIGATVNMDGTALFVTVASIFIAQMNNVELTAVDYVTVVLTATAASIASASVPSAALVLMLIVLSAINVPVQDVSLLWAVDWFVDRCRTTNNMLGDCYAAAVVQSLSRSELEMMDKMDKVRKEETNQMEGREMVDSGETQALMSPSTEETRTVIDEVDQSSVEDVSSKDANIV